MARQNLLLLAGLCCTLTIAACGDDPVPSNNTTPDMADMTTTTDMADMPAADMPVADMPTGDVTAENYPTEFAEAFCAKAESCCTPQDYMDNFEGADCAATFGMLYTDILPTAQDVTSGKIDFNAAIAKSAIDLIAATSCASLNMEQDFPLPYVGKVAPGGACEGSFECAEPAGKEVYCGTTCIVIKDRGEACASSDECNIDSYCGPDGTCDAPLPADADCTDDFDCQSTLCGVTVEGKCDAQVALGEDCMGDSECVSGSCDFDTTVCVEATEQLFCDGLF